MRVLYFHQHFSTPQGAAGIRSYQMAKQLVNSGHQVTMVCGSYGQSKTGLQGDFINGKRTGSYQGIDIIEFELDYSNEMSFLKRAGVFFKYAFRSVKEVFKQEYDVIFATTTPLTAAIPGIIAKIFRRKKFVFEVRDLWPELPKAMGVITNPIILNLMKVLEVVAYKCADKHIALSPGIKKGIERHISSKKKVELIPNGCDLDIFASSQELWQPEGVSDSDFLAVFTGTHGLANGLNNVLKAAKNLKERNIENIKIVLIGHGKLKQELMEQAQQAKLDNVIFHEPVKKDKLAKLMKRADCGLQTLANVPAFYYGTSPNKFFDYLSAGLPVVNNYPGWVAELITENQCGLAVEPESPESFANALIQLQSDPKALVEYSQNSSKLANEEFDRSKLSRKWVSVLEGVVNEKAL